MALLHRGERRSQQFGAGGLVEDLLGADAAQLDDAAVQVLAPDLLLRQVHLEGHLLGLDFLAAGAHEPQPLLGLARAADQLAVAILGLVQPRLDAVALLGADRPVAGERVHRGCGRRRCGERAVPSRPPARRGGGWRARSRRRGAPGACPGGPCARGRRRVAPAARRAAPSASAPRAGARTDRPPASASSSSWRARAAARSLRRLRSCSRPSSTCSRSAPTRPDNSVRRSRWVACAPRFWRENSKSFSREAICWPMARPSCSSVRALVIERDHALANLALALAEFRGPLAGGRRDRLRLPNRAHEREQFARGVEAARGHRAVGPEHLAERRDERAPQGALAPDGDCRGEALDEMDVPEQVLGERPQIGGRRHDVDQAGQPPRCGCGRLRPRRGAGRSAGRCRAPRCLPGGRAPPRCRFPGRSRAGI